MEERTIKTKKREEAQKLEFPALLFLTRNGYLKKGEKLLKKTLGAFFTNRPSLMKVHNITCASSREEMLRSLLRYIESKPSEL